MKQAIEVGGRRYVHDGKVLKIYINKGNGWQFSLGCMVKRPDKLLSRETGLSVSEIADLWANVE